MAAVNSMLSQEPEHKAANLLKTFLHMPRLHKLTCNHNQYTSLYAR